MKNGHLIDLKDWALHSVFIFIFFWNHKSFIYWSDISYLKMRYFWLTKWHHLKILFLVIPLYFVLFFAPSDWIMGNFFVDRPGGSSVVASLWGLIPFCKLATHLLSLSIKYQLPFSELFILNIISMVALLVCRLLWVHQHSLPNWL